MVQLSIEMSIYVGQHLRLSTTANQHFLSTRRANGEAAKHHVDHAKLRRRYHGESFRTSFYIKPQLGRPAPKKES